MSASTLSLPLIQLVGIQCRTNNADEQDQKKAKIGALWMRYMNDHIAQQIPHRKNKGVTFSAYTDYENDMQGQYTCFIGEEVDSLDNIPPTLSILLIPCQRYKKFTSEQGMMPAVCIDLWQKIWAEYPVAMAGERAYLADFERYDERAQDPQHTTLDIYIGLKD